MSLLCQGELRSLEGVEGIRLGCYAGCSSSSGSIRQLNEHLEKHQNVKVPKGKGIKPEITQETFQTVRNIANAQRLHPYHDKVTALSKAVQPDVDVYHLRTSVYKGTARRVAKDDKGKDPKCRAIVDHIRKLAAPETPWFAQKDEEVQREIVINMCDLVPFFLTALAKDGYCFYDNGQDGGKQDDAKVAEPVQVIEQVEMEKQGPAEGREQLKGKDNGHPQYLEHTGVGLADESGKPSAAVEAIQFPVWNLPSPMATNSAQPFSQSMGVSGGRRLAEGSSAVSAVVHATQLSQLCDSQWTMPCHRATNCAQLFNQNIEVANGQGLEGSGQPLLKGGWPMCEECYGEGCQACYMPVNFNHDSVAGIGEDLLGAENMVGATFSDLDEMMKGWTEDHGMEDAT